MTPESSAMHMQRAVAAHQRGALEEAERDYRAVLATEPQHADATHFLGLLLHQRGDAAGFALMQQSLQLSPANYQFRGNFASVFMQLGRRAEAERLYREAVTLNPGYLGGYLNLGMLYAEQGDHPRALTEFDAALRLDRGSFDAWFNRAESLQQLARRQESLQSYRHAATAAKDDLDLQLMVASALREAGEIEDARHCHERALKLAPDSPLAENSLGNLIGMQGDLAVAETHYRRALALKPDYAGAYYNLAEVKRLTPEDPAWDGLMQLSGRAAALPAEEAIPLHFTLGRVWDGGGEHAQAFAQLQAGNRLKRASLNYDEPAQARFFQEFAEVFGADFIGARRLDTVDPRPVFIVGMPRSGTTLVEQILASHPEVHGAGEVHALRNSLREELPPDEGDYRLPGQLAELEPEGFRRAAARYSRFLDALAPKAKRISNKLPGNMVLVGLVSLLYPEARIIHCSREPLDTCFSCYSKLFTTGHPFSYELGELGRFYRMYEQLMHHWRIALPGRMLELRYEELVGDLDGQARRLIAHLDLPWDEACLRFHESGRAVRTASLAQVRRPIYKDSVGRWKNYEKELAPLREALKS